MTRSSRTISLPESIRRLGQLTRSQRVTLAAFALLAGLAAPALSGHATLAAFVATTPNTGNQVSSGTVELTDNDSGGSLFSLSGLEPNNTNTSCIKITALGSLPSSVRLYGTTTSSGLDAHTGVVVTRGHYSPSEPAFGSCTNFVADGATYLTGQPQGAVYAGTLQDYPDTWAAGIVDPAPGSPETWNTSESHVYKLQLTVSDNRSAEGKDANQSFTWEAQNQ